MALDADKLLVARCQAGDREAFAALVRRYQRQVYALAYRLVGDCSEAEDIAQEAFLRCYRSLTRFRTEQPLGPWLYRIATNVALDRLRRRGREVLIGADEPATARPDWASNPDMQAPGPDEQALRREKQRRLAAAIADLPPEYRVPVVLFHLHGLSVAEVALVIGVPPTVVKNRLYRARKMLRQALREHDEEATRRCRDEQLSVGDPVGSLR